MTHLDWHAQRSNDSWPSALKSNPESGAIDLVAVRRYRLGRVREEMARQGVDALILSDPVNIRYATGTRNMQVFSARNAPARYLLVTSTRTLLYEFTGCMHLADGFETVDEVRPALTASFVAAGPRIAEAERNWAKQVRDALLPLVGDNPVLGMERVNAGAVLAMAAHGMRLVDAQSVLEMARAIKSPEEVKCVVAALRSTESAVEQLRAAIRPGITENALWSVLHRSIIADDGDYCETRLLNSGQRTNPWFQETGSKVIGDNELVALDTDVVGCHGYYSDFSRTFHSGPDRPDRQQRILYQVACEQVQHNIGILAPGLGFREYAERAWQIPERYFENRYYLSAHGCGMTGEYPYLYHRADFADAGYDGILQPGMVICVESYIGEAGGSQGVKLEEQVLITDNGVELLSRFPLESSLLAS
ncbi:MAG: Xaa-Pro peptidase family protein [Sedimenticola sp.]|nr:Xaa-Pro peptidase family protein [Sedimenticola sp.]